MLKFYELNEKVQKLSAQLAWSHYTELLSLNDNMKINYYIMICEKQNLSVRELRQRIKSYEYERLPDNTKNNLLEKTESTVTDFIKNPMMIKNTNGYSEISEKTIIEINNRKYWIIYERIRRFIFFIGSEYKINIGNTYNYIDLLLFNIDYNYYVVVELKVAELKKEHIGQIQVYMNYIDDNLKKINQNKTIGIIISKQDNKYVIKYCSDKRIISRVYELIWYNNFGVILWFIKQECYVNILKVVIY